MECQTFARRVQDYLDGELDTEDTRAMDDHAAGCRRCDVSLVQYRALFRILNRLAPEPAPPGFEDAVLLQLQLAT